MVDYDVRAWWVYKPLTRKVHMIIRHWDWRRDIDIAVDDIVIVHEVKVKCGATRFVGDKVDSQVRLSKETMVSKRSRSPPLLGERRV